MLRKKALRCFIVCCIYAGIYSPQAIAELALPNVPLISESKAAPNMLFLIDDSGSMDWEIITQPHYSVCNYINPDSYSNCSTTLNDSGLFYYSEPDSATSSFVEREIYYLYSESNKYNLLTAIAFTDMIDQDWRIYDHRFNQLYYDPDVSYAPWRGPCSQDTDDLNLVYCNDANFTAAQVHPKIGNSDYGTTVNLDAHMYDGNRHVHQYVVSLDDRGFAGTTPAPNLIVAGTNGMVDPWDTHAIITFENSDTVTFKVYKTDPVSGLKSLVQSDTMGNLNYCYNALGPTQYIKEIIAGTRPATSQGGVACRTIAQARTNYANWYQYYRKRAYTAKAAVSYVMDVFPAVHYGLAYINDSTIAVPVPAEGENVYQHRLALLDNFFEDSQEKLGTPLRSALHLAGRYYSGELSLENPIKYECQLNSALIITDGYYNGSSPLLGDVDGDGYGGSIGGSTLADIARYYYVNDLNTSLDNMVPTSDVDPNDQQHMNTFGISFGLSANLTPGSDGWPDPSLTYDSDWGDPTDCEFCPEKVNDLWHAAYNSHGKFGSVNNIPEMIYMLKSSLGQVEKINRASLSSATVPAAILNTDMLIYQATFSSNPWHGDLSAYRLSKQGVLDANRVFSAGQLLNARNYRNRVILTYNHEVGIPFLWDGKGLGQTDFSFHQAKAIQEFTQLINKKVKGFNKLEEEEIIDYLRGDRSNEASKGGGLRTRYSLLGDFVHSSPHYIANPNLVYQEESYLTFKETYKNRTHMVAGGANDGMLHIFNAQTGEEMMAYVPGHMGLWHNLGHFSDTIYNHQFYVDGSLNTNDIFLHSANQWRTILVGALRSGGQAIYALDVTSGEFEQTYEAAANIVMFEFDDSDDADLGYTFGTPQIVKMQNDRWAIILGNGYNSTKGTYPSGETDPHVSSTGKAALFILFIDGGLDGNWTEGTDYIKVYAGTNTQNGLSEPFPVDIDGDYKVDYIYAGALDGSVYKFDVTSSTASNWASSESVSTFFSGSAAKPITTPLVVGAHPDGVQNGVMVYFGTGKYLENSDNSNYNQPTQTFYGLWDKNDGLQATLTDASSLLEQTILGSQGGMRASTNTNIDFTTHEGWFMDLEVQGENYGERVLGRPQLRNGRVIFTTVIANGADAGICDPNTGMSWVMELDAHDGSRLGFPPFDVNKDGYFDKADYITFTPAEGSDALTVPHSGIKSDAGVLGGNPIILSNQEGDKEFKILSGSGGLTVQTESVDDRGRGRQSWQQVY